MTAVRIVLADDHTLVRESLCRLLEPTFSVVGSVENGRDLLRSVEALHPDLVLLDISMPLMSGFEVLPRLQQVAPRTKVIVVTMHLESALVTEAFRSGVSGYVLKQSAASELIAAVQTVLRNGRYLSAGLPAGTRERALADTREGMAPAPRRKPADDLTPRQRQVLSLMAQGQTTADIARTLAISPKTVEFHKTNIMRELGLRRTVDLTRFAGGG